MKKLITTCLLALPLFIGGALNAEEDDNASDSNETVITYADLKPSEFLQNGGDSGDTAWMIVATALVLLMTIPGLSLFYGGLTRKKNVLSVLVQ